MKINFKLILVLLFMGLYLNGNISFNNPVALYADYKNSSDINEIIRDHRKDNTKYNGIICAKEEMTNTILNSTKLSEYEKRKLILSVKYVKVLIVDFSKYENDYLKSLNGLYWRKRTHGTNYILISKKLVEEDELKATVLHELTHLKDDGLVDGEKTYSDVNNIDVIDRTLTPEKLKIKIDNLMVLYRGGKDTKPENEIFFKDLKYGIYDYVSSNVPYITSKEEIYVRLAMMRKYLLDHGRIKTFDQDLTNEDFIYLFSPEVIIGESTPPQFLELIFLMNIDITPDENRINVKCLDIINKIP